MNLEPRNTVAAQVEPRVRARGEAGYSLLEVTIATMMLLMLSWLVVTLSNQGMRTQNFSQRMSRVTEITQDVLDDVRNGLTSSVRVFGNDAIGSAYLTRVELATDMQAPMAGLRLPAIRANARLEPEDPADLRTGNTLFLARYAWTDEFEVTSGSVYRIDIYRVEWWYLTPAGPGPRAGVPDGINMARWVSEPLADASQALRIADDTDRAEVLVHLVSASPDRFGVTRDAVGVVWDVGGDPAAVETFRQIDALGDLHEEPFSPRTSPWVIEPELALCNRDILDYRHHSVATNFAPQQMGVGRFSDMDIQSPGGFPHGLEIQVVGPSSSRQVLIHLSLVTTRADDHRAFYDMQTIADVRDN